MTDFMTVNDFIDACAHQSISTTNRKQERKNDREKKGIDNGLRINLYLSVGGKKVVESRRKIRSIAPFERVDYNNIIYINIKVQQK